MATPTPTPGLFHSIWSSPMWGPLGVISGIVLGFVGGGFAIFKYWKGRQFKELSYSILSDSLLANIDEGLSVSTNIKVMVGTRQVKNVRYVALRIRNSGNIPITEEDFTVPLWFLEGQTFRDNNLVSANVYETQPLNIPVKIEINEKNDKVSITKALLNSGDAIFVAMLLSDYSDKITVNGRVIGVKEIKEEAFVPKQPFNFGQFLGQVGIFILIIGIISAILGLPFFFALHVNYLASLVTSFLTIALLCLLLIIYGKIKQLIHR